MAQTAGGTYYAASSELVSSWPATSLDLANQLESRFAAKASLSGATYTGTHNFSSATVTGIASGLALISPTSIANSGGSASASGGAVTFSGVTTVSLNGVFSSTYENYRVIYSLSSTSASLYLQARLRASGTDATGSNYTTQDFYGEASSVGAARITSSTAWQIGYNHISSNGSNGLFDFFNPFAAAYTRIHGSQSYLNGGSTLLINVSTVANHTLTTSYDGFTLQLSGSGNFTGTVRVYGYRN